MCLEILLVCLEFNQVNSYLLITYRKVEAFNNPNCLTKKKHFSSSKIICIERTKLPPFTFGVRLVTPIALRLPLLLLRMALLVI